MIRLISMLLLAAVSSQSLAEVGREFNWLTPGSVNRVPQSLPAAQSDPTAQETAGEGGYSLPPIADDTGHISASVAVHVVSIELVGNTVLPEAQVQTAIAPYTNRTINMAELRNLRLQLSQLYVNRGYLNSGVIIPDQRVEQGKVVLQAVEGSLQSVQVEGDPKLADRYIRSKLEQRISTPLNVNDVKRALQNLQRDPHVTSVDARLVPGDTMGAGVLKIEVDEPKRFEVGIAADNHHTSSAGAEKGRVFFSASNLTGFGEVFRASTSTSEGTDETAASLELPISAWNTRTQAYYARSDSDIVEDAFDELDIESETETIGLTFTQPFVDDLNNTVAAMLGLEVKNSQTKLLGERFSFSPGAQDGAADVAVALFGLDWVNRGENHVAALRGTWRHGMDAIGATVFEPTSALDQLSNPTGADGEFDALLTQALFIKRLNSFNFAKGLNDRAQLIARGVGQFSFDPLMSLEKLAIGGANTVRGYPENLLVRDSGAAATFELQFPIGGYIPRPHWRNLVVSQFIDVGASWDDTDVDLASSIRDTDDTRVIVGTGLGLIWEPLEGLRAELYWAYDTWDNFDGDDPRDSNSRDDSLQDDGIHFALSFARRF